MSTGRSALLGAAVLVCLLTVGGCVPLEQDVDATGTWTGTRVWQEGSLEGISTPLTLVLTQEGRTVSGEVRVMAGQQAIPLPVIRGSVRGRGVLIEASGTPEIGGVPVAITFSLQGDVNGNVMTGSGSETVAGGQNPFVFEVERPAPPPEE